MKKCKITILKTTYDEELGKEYGVETACPMMSTGQVFYGDYAKPEGFCDWIKKPGVAICSCNDGIRPVIFKIEATDEIATLPYDPIR